MARLILTIVALGALLALVKAVIVALVVAGLIFRTQQTVGLLLVGGLLTLTAAHPPAGFALLALIAAAALALHRREDAMAQAIDDPPQE